MQYRVIVLGTAAFLLAAGPAFANHGKVGLWNVISTVEVALPANLATKTKKAPAMIMPPPVNVQMCMSKEEVEANAPPHLDQGSTGCVTRLESQTPNAMRANLVCNGQLKGTGRIEITYQGTEHYSGSYSFKGTSYGRPSSMTTTFKGDWVKADCGKVKPYKLRTQ